MVSLFSKFCQRNFLEFYFSRHPSLEVHKGNGNFNFRKTYNFVYFEIAIKLNCKIQSSWKLYGTLKKIFTYRWSQLKWLYCGTKTKNIFYFDWFISLFRLKFYWYCSELQTSSCSIFSRFLNININRIYVRK